MPSPAADCAPPFTPRRARADAIPAVERSLGAAGRPLAGVADLLTRHPADLFVVDEPGRPSELAAVAGLDALYPLTTAAEHFFARVGFVRVARAAVPPRIAGTLELASDCPASVTTARTLEGATPLPRPAAEHPAA